MYPHFCGRHILTGKAGRKKPVFDLILTQLKESIMVRKLNDLNDPFNYLNDPSTNPLNDPSNLYINIEYKMYINIKNIIYKIFLNIKNLKYKFYMNIKNIKYA